MVKHALYRTDSSLPWKEFSTLVTEKVAIVKRRSKGFGGKEQSFPSEQVSFPKEQVSFPKEQVRVMFLKTGEYALVDVFSTEISNN